MTSGENGRFTLWSAVGNEAPHRFVALVPAESGVAAALCLRTPNLDFTGVALAGLCVMI